MKNSLRKVMFGFYKTNGFTPLSCPLEMAANRFHAHSDSTSETTSHRANGNTELCRYYSTCACATGIKVHVSLAVTSETLREHSVFRISGILILASRFPEEPGLSLQHAFSGYVSKRWTKCRPSQFIIKPGLTITYERQASSPIITHTTTTERFSTLLSFAHDVFFPQMIRSTTFKEVHDQPRVICCNASSVTHIGWSSFPVLNTHTHTHTYRAL